MAKQTMKLPKILLILLMLITLCSFTYATTYFVDDFDADNMSWTNGAAVVWSGNAAVDTGNSRLGYSSIGQGGGANTGLTQNLELTNFTIQLRDFQKINSGSGLFHTFISIGNISTSKYYSFIIQAGAAPAYCGINNGMCIARYDSGTPTYIGAVDTGITVTDLHDYNITKWQNGTFELWVDGVQKIAFHDSEYNFTADTVTFDSNNDGAYIGRIEITDTIEGEPTGVITLINPTNGQKNNTNPQFLIETSTTFDNCSLYGNWTGTWKINQTKFLVNSSLNNTFSLTDQLPDNTYLWNVECENSLWGLTNYTFTIDTAQPDITLNSNNAFNTQNFSNVNQYSNIMPINITMEDDNDLFGFLINITKDGISVFNYSNESLSGLTTFNYLNNINISTWTTARYNITIQSSDSHTVNEIPDFRPVIKPGELEYRTDQSNVRIVSSDAINSNTFKRTDRYNFEFDYASKSLTRTYELYSDKKIHYLINSGYIAHFVTGHQWIDFENDNIISSKITKRSDYHYTIDLTFSKESLKQIFKSIGGLNINTKEYMWYKGNHSITAPTAFSTETTNITLNITLDSLKMSTINASLIYNGVTYPNTNKGIFTNYIIFSQEVVTPNVETNVLFDFNWSVDVQQTNSDNITFNLSGTQSITGFSVDNCTIANASALNVSFFDLNNVEVLVDYDTTIFYGINLVNLSKNFSNSETSISNFSYCIFPATSQIFSDIGIEYRNGSQVYNYVVKNVTLNGTTQFLNLYIDPSATTQVLFTLVDQNNKVIPDVFLHVLKYDLGTNTFRTTEIIQTDDEGTAIANIELIDGLYKFLVFTSGGIQIYSNPTDGEGGIRILTNTRTFQINLLGDDWYDESINVLETTTSLTFNNATKRFTFTWTNPSGLSLEGCLKVINRTRTTETQINNTCLTTSSGSIIQYIGTDTFQPNTQYIATAYFGLNEPEIVDTLSVGLDDNFNFYNLDKTGDTVLLSSFIILALAFLGIPFPIVSLIFMAVGFIFLFFIGMFKMSFAFLVGIILVTLIHLYKQGK